MNDLEFVISLYLDSRIDFDKAAEEIRKLDCKFHSHSEVERLNKYLEFRPCSIVISKINCLIKLIKNMYPTYYVLLRDKESLVCIFGYDSDPICLYSSNDIKKLGEYIRKEFVNTSEVF